MTFPIQKLLVALRWPQMNVALVTSSGQFNPDGEGRCSQELKGEMFLFYFFFGGGGMFLKPGTPPRGITFSEIWIIPSHEIKALQVC